MDGSAAQRFALEMAWHAIEDAGLKASALAGSRTGVYMGVCHWDYAELIQKHLARVDAHTPTGIAFSVIANRVSHAFDFRGPSVTNDTACAASLVAINDAVRDLESGACDLALAAGGVNLGVVVRIFRCFREKRHALSRWIGESVDARADGYVRGEGGAVLLLKPLARAEADGDPIHAIIAGIGPNDGGRTSSLTVTNPNAQAELIADVHRQAGIAPESISYIEAHGPGTPLGDPIEIAELKAAFRTRAVEAGVELSAEQLWHRFGQDQHRPSRRRGWRGRCRQGARGVASRGAAGERRVGTLNPLIDLTGTPFRIQSEMTAWPRVDGSPRRAGVSSFGFGGTNAHRDDRETAPVPDDKRGVAASLLVPLSARTDEALRRYAHDLRDFLARRPDLNLADLALTFQAGREAMASRVAFVVEDVVALSAALDAFLTGSHGDRVRTVTSEAAVEEPWRAADLWVAGGDIAFEAPQGARRLHVPLYPFTRERYWFDTAFGAKDTAGVPHPFLHRNLSTFDAVAYRSRFSGSEFFFADHCVQGSKYLAGRRCARNGACRVCDGRRSANALAFDGVIWTASHRGR